MENIKDRSKGRGRIVKVFLAISLMAVAFCAAGLGLELYNNGQGQAYYASLSVDVQPRVAQPPQEQRPEEWQPYLDFNALRERCPDVVAWIRSEGTPLNYPIVQGRDNDFYLSHLPDGSKNGLGSIFMDFRSQAVFTDPNTLIYGHETKSGSMFGSLKQYRDPQFYLDHPTLSIYTQEKDYTLQLIAGYVVNSTYEVPPMAFLGEEEFSAYITDIQNRSVFSAQVPVNMEDRLVSLCTCDYSVKNGRLVLVGKLVEAQG